MSGEALTWLLFLLVAFIVFLFGFYFLRKLFMISVEKITTNAKNEIKVKIEGCLSEPIPEYRDGYIDDFVQAALDRGKNYRALVDSYLLGALEGQAKKENRRLLISIAAQMGFANECIAEIKSRKFRISGIGARRAGLYRFAQASDELISALEILTSQNQYEILLAIARIGDAETMRLAFETIRDNMLINERAVARILSAFSAGEEKVKLFRTMIHSGTDYIAVLFLKAADGDMAGALLGDIIDLLHNGDKEIRTAAVRCLAGMGEKGPEEEIISALGDNDWEVRALAAKALGEIKTSKSSLALFRALSDRQWWVRQNAAKALAGHPGCETMFMLAAESGDEYAKDSILSVLEDEGSPFLQRYVRILGA
ncbi:MAG: HEAT repeat domain-containing protein [Treponema sp.]|nr:HEAT repeat domain-containing protein [Treponema sp.]